MAENEVKFSIIFDTDQSTKAINKLRDQLNKQRDVFRGVQRVGARALAVTGAAFVATSFAAIRFERALVDVSKTTDIVDDDLKDLGKELISLSTELLRSSKDLAVIAFSAGQLGIKGKKNILDFTKSVALISTALGFAADFASTAFGRISLGFRLPIKDIERLGSAINELENTTSAKTRQMTVAILATVPVLGQLGFKARDIAGLTATIIEVTGSGERAGLALAQFFTQAATKLDDLAIVTNKTKGELQELFDTDPTQFFITVQEGFGQIESEAVRAAEATRIFGRQGRRAVLGTTESLDRLNRNLKISREAFDENVSIQKEFERVSAATSSQIKKLGISITNAGIVIGEFFLPAINAGTKALTKLSQFIVNLSPTTKSLIATLLGLVTAISGLVFLAGTLGVAFFGIKIGMVSLATVAGGILVPAFGSLAIAIGAVQTALIPALAALALPTAAVIAVIAAVKLLAKTFDIGFEDIKTIVANGADFVLTKLTNLKSRVLNFFKTKFFSGGIGFDELNEEIDKNNEDLKTRTDERLAVLAEFKRKRDELIRGAPPGFVGPPLPPGFVPPTQPGAAPVPVAEGADSTFLDEAERNRRIAIAEETANAILAIKMRQTVDEIEELRNRIELEREIELERLELKRQQLEEEKVLTATAAEEIARTKLEINKKFDKLEKARQEKEFKIRKKALGEEFLLLSDFFEKGLAAQSIVAKKNQIIATFEATVDTAKAVIKALSSAPFPKNIGNAAIVGAIGLANIKAIQSPTLPQFQFGAANLPDDTVGLFNRAEIVVPAAFSEGIRSGELTLSGGGTEAGGAEEPTTVINIDLSNSTFLGGREAVDVITREITEQSNVVGSPVAIIQ